MGDLNLRAENRQVGASKVVWTSPAVSSLSLTSPTAASAA
jgi:hypothetical protein